MMGRSLVAGLGLLSVLGALVVVGYLTVRSLGDDLIGDPAGGSSGEAGSLVLRLSGTPGVAFSGDYTTPSGTQNISGTLGATPVDYDISGDGVAGVNVVTVNVRVQGMTGSLKAELLDNGQVVQSQETNATTGAVSLTHSP